MKVKILLIVCMMLFVVGCNKVPTVQEKSVADAEDAPIETTLDDTEVAENVSDEDSDPAEDGELQDEPSAEDITVLYPENAAIAGSSEWASGKMLLGNDTFALPSTYDTLIDNGWSCKDCDDDTTISSGNVLGFDFTKGDNTIHFIFYNPTEDTISVQDAKLYSLTAEDYLNSDISIDGVKLGMSYEEVRGILGDPTGEYLKDSFKRIDYETTELEYQVFFIFGDGDKLSSIRLSSYLSD